MVEAGRVVAWQGTARLGVARRDEPDEDRLGIAGHGLAWQCAAGGATHGVARRAVARPGGAWQERQ